MDDTNQIIHEYEVFTNNQNAIGVFLERNAVLDQMGDTDSFLFAINQQKELLVGTSSSHVTLPDVPVEILATARERGVIMLVEFENQQPLRCTPCYLNK